MMRTDDRMTVSILRQPSAYHPSITLALTRLAPRRRVAGLGLQVESGRCGLRTFGLHSPVEFGKREWTLRAGRLGVRLVRRMLISACLAARAMRI
jgi:hypothetical protein